MGLDSVELLMEVEETFGIEITDREAGKIVTVGDFYNTVISKLNAGNRQIDKQEVWETLRRCIVEIGGVKPEKVVSEAEIVKDLGIN